MFYLFWVNSPGFMRANVIKRILYNQPIERGNVNL